VYAKSANQVMVATSKYDSNHLDRLRHGLEIQIDS